MAQRTCSSTGRDASACEEMYSSTDLKSVLAIVSSHKFDCTSPILGRSHVRFSDRRCEPIDRLGFQNRSSLASPAQKKANGRRNARVPGDIRMVRKKAARGSRRPAMQYMLMIYLDEAEAAKIPPERMEKMLP